MQSLEKLCCYDNCLFPAPLPQFPDMLALDRDSYVAHKSAGIACLIENYVVITLHKQELMQQSETNLR